MYEPMWPFLLMYWSHDMRHAGFRRLTVVNGTPGIGASHDLHSSPLSFILLTMTCILISNDTLMYKFFTFYFYFLIRVKT